MKKILLIIILTILSIQNIKAYENEYFKIELPEQYKENIIEENTYKWINDNKYISITIANNNELNYDIKTYTEEDIANQKKYIEENINKTLKEYNISVNVTDIKKIQLENELYSLNYSIYWPTKDHTGYNMNQIGNVISTDNYIFTIIYSSDTEINQEEYNSIINSLEINDTTNKRKINSKVCLMLIVLIASFFTVLRLTKKYKKN